MSDLAHLFGQRDYAVRFDWGPTGAKATAADAAVVVDVLSFSTSVCIAVEREMRVYPSPWKGAQAEAFAREHHAVLAVGRLEATKPGAVPAPSLSPAGLLSCEPVSRWDHDDSLRPALEDQLGAGAILSALSHLGYKRSMSPEASATADLFDAAQGSSLAERMNACVGACELASKGFRSDVDVAAALDSSRVVPVLTDGSFGAAR